MMKFTLFSVAILGLAVVANSAIVQDEKVDCSASQQCPETWQLCFKGKCQDKCIKMFCPICFEGACAGTPLRPKCNSDTPCPETWQICQNGRCLDSCVNLSGCSNCEKGVCLDPTEPSCTGDSDCPETWQYCRKDKCRDKCEKTFCPVCYQGVCNVIKGSIFN